MKFAVGDVVVPNSFADKYTFTNKKRLKSAIVEHVNDENNKIIIRNLVWNDEEQPLCPSPSYEVDASAFSHRDEIKITITQGEKNGEIIAQCTVGHTVVAETLENDSDFIEGAKTAFQKIAKTLKKKKAIEKKKIEVGDFVRVVNDEFCYPYYSDWFKKNEHEEHSPRYCYGIPRFMEAFDFDENTVFAVVATEKDKNKSENIFAICPLGTDGEYDLKVCPPVFLIDGKGIVKTDI